MFSPKRVSNLGRLTVVFFLNQSPIDLTWPNYLVHSISFLLFIFFLRSLLILILLKSFSYLRLLFSFSCFAYFRLFSYVLCTSFASFINCSLTRFTLCSFSLSPLSSSLLFNPSHASFPFSSLFTLCLLERASPNGPAPAGALSGVETAGSTPGLLMLWYTGKCTVSTVKYPTEEYSEEWRWLGLLQARRCYGTQVSKAVNREDKRSRR